MLLDTKPFFMAILLHNKLKTPSEKHADLAGRLTILANDQGTNSLVRRCLHAFIARELARTRHVNKVAT